jgi:hypothetical protein
MKPAKPFKQSILLFLCIGIVNAYAQSISGVVNSYYKVTAVNSASNTVTVSNSAGLIANTRILLIQMKGATINSSNSSSYGDISAINDAGNYEMNTICSVVGNDVVLQFQMLKSYTASGSVQLVTVPSYQSVTISDTVKSTAWDAASGTGGVVAIEAIDTIYLNSGIDVSGQGFVGGALQNYATPTYDCSSAVNVTAYYFPFPTSIYQNGGMKGEGITDYIANEEYGRGKLANGGGGGNNQNTGGGGGGNYAAGGVGGQRKNETAFQCHGTNPGVGGAALSAYGYSVANNRVFLGGGGGSGHENNAVGLPGGNGGGIVLLSAKVITAAGTSILANGGRPYNAVLTDPYQASGDGGGGGGAGGTVLINAAVNGTINVSANGADGGNSSYPFANACMGPGGGGAGGVVWVAGLSFPGSIMASVTAGANGVISPSNTFGCAGNSNSAAPGTNGNAQPNYVLPAGVTKVCVPLPIPGLQYFTGALTSNGAILTWQMNSVDEVYSYELESSDDRFSYSALATIKNAGGLRINYADTRIIDGTVYYRLMMIKKDGSVYYSEIVALTRNISGSLQFISLRPNPATDQLTVVLYSKMSLHAAVILYNSYGQGIADFSDQLIPGYNKIILPLSSLSSGMYYLKITGNDFAVIKNFIRQ